MENKSRDKWDAKHFKWAKELVLREGYASCALLKTKLAFGDNKAGRIMDELEDAGIIAPFEGSKKRRILAATPNAMLAVSLPSEGWEDIRNKYGESETTQRFERWLEVNYEAPIKRGNDR